MKVSIIIPVYNGEETIEKSILSCVNQTYQNIEILVIDNASIDNTENIVKRFNDRRLKYIYISEKGRSRARNKGIELSSGELIQFLDADDELKKDKIEKSVNIITKENVNAVQCSTMYYDSLRGTSSVHRPYCKEDFYEHLFISNSIPINSILLKKKICERFPEDIEYCEDWMFFLRSLQTEGTAFINSYVGAIVNIHGNNTMSNYLSMKSYQLLVMEKFLKKRLSFKNEIKRKMVYIYIFIEVILEERNTKSSVIDIKNFSNYKLVNFVCQWSMSRKVLSRMIGVKNGERLYKKNSS